jgi:hypothetical protein
MAYLSFLKKVKLVFRACLTITYCFEREVLAGFKAAGSICPEAYKSIRRGQIEPRTQKPDPPSGEVSLKADPPSGEVSLKADKRAAQN